MTSRVEQDAAMGIVDPACVPDTFVEGIGLIEWIAGSSLRITLYANRDLGDGASERLVVARLVTPASLVPNGIRQVMAAVLQRPFMSDSRGRDIVPH